jgi:hypothetical protein
VKTLSILLLLSCFSFSATGFTWKWNINLAGDTATVLKWKANNDSVLNWSNRIGDTLNKKPTFSQVYRNSDSIFTKMNIDTIIGRVKIDTIKNKVRIDTIANKVRIDTIANKVRIDTALIGNMTLTTARTIGNTSFDGTANIVPDTSKSSKYWSGYVMPSPSSGWLRYNGGLSWSTPTYTDVGAFPATHGVSTNYLARATSTTVFGNSALYDNGGNIGIGISPIRQFHVSGDGQATNNITDAGNNGGTIYIQDAHGGTDNGGAIIFGAYQGFFAGIKALIIDGTPNTTGSLIFLTRGSISDNYLTERMRIDMSGRVGIGKSPSYPLDVEGRVKASSFTTNGEDSITYNDTTFYDSIYDGSTYRARQLSRIVRIGNVVTLYQGQILGIITASTETTIRGIPEMFTTGLSSTNIWTSWMLENSAYIIGVISPKVSHPSHLGIYKTPSKSTLDAGLGGLNHSISLTWILE